MDGQVNIGDAIKYGWDKFSANVAPFLLIGLILGAATVVAYVLFFILIMGTVSVAAYSNMDSSVASLIIVLVSTLAIVLVGLVAAVLNMAFYQAALDVVRGRPVDLARSFRTDNLKPYATLVLLLLAAYFVGNVVLSFIPIVGSFVLFVALLAAGVLLYFAPYLVLDRGMGAVDAVKTSYQMAMSNIGQTILVVLVLGLIAGAGSIVCGVGAFVTVPIAVIGGAFAYVVMQREQPAP